MNGNHPLIQSLSVVFYLLIMIHSGMTDRLTSFLWTPLGSKSTGMVTCSVGEADSVINE